MATSSGNSSINERDRPEPKVVSDFHTNADTDADKDSIHHTLGVGIHQASPGSHRHDGKDSVPLLEGYEITGGTDADKILSIIGALQQLGAVDSTNQAGV